MLCGLRFFLTGVVRLLKKKLH